MRKLSFLFILTVLYCTTIFAQSNKKLSKDFQKLLERSNMSFEPIQSWKKTKIIDNYQMGYQYALKHPTENFEVRYSINPLDDDLKQYAEEMKKDSSSTRLHPNHYYKSSMYAILSNVSDGKVGLGAKFNTFPKESVRKEFNADWGATAMLEVGKTFGQKYKYCMVVAIHKDNQADAYYFYLGDNPEDFPKLMQGMFYSLKFK